MAHIWIQDSQQQITQRADIEIYLRRYGIWYEHWDVEGRVDVNAEAEDILNAYAPEIQRLIQRGNYVTADVINVSPSTPNLEALLDKFNKEHTHDEDEVRFVVDGSGVFHVNPVSNPVFAVEMHSGDLINVPRGTRHWFNLCGDKTIKTIRLFQDPSGWTPHYLDNSAHSNYEPLCFGPSYLPGALAKGEKR